MQTNVHGQRRRGKQFTFYKEVKFEYINCEDATADVDEYLKKHDIVQFTREISYSFGNEKAEAAFKSSSKETIE